MSVDLYNLFHKNTKAQSKVIDSKNFTYRLIIEHLESVLDTKKTILDYGSGAGTIDLYLASLGHKVIGLDISNTAIESAKLSAEKLNLKNADFWTSKDGLKKISKIRFDLVICTEVIEHVKDDIGLLRFLNKKLKRNGVVFLSTPSKNAPLYRLGFANEFDLRVGHLRRYTENQLKNLFIESGFNIEAFYKTEGILRNLLFLNPVLGKFVRFIKGPISDSVTTIDDWLVRLFGESDFIVIARKT